MSKGIEAHDCTTECSSFFELVDFLSLFQPSRHQAGLKEGIVFLGPSR